MLLLCALLLLLLPFPHTNPPHCYVCILLLVLSDSILAVLVVATCVSPPPRA